MTDEILIQKEDEVFFRVETDAGIRMELYEHFSFMAPGYQYDKRFKKKLWDGKIRLFRLNESKLYVGLLRDLVEFAAARNYWVRIVDGDNGYRFESPDVVQVDPSEIVSSKKLRNYQAEAVIESMSRRRCLMLSPTGSGKSLIIYHLVRLFMNQHRKRVLIIVPRVSLVSQMIEHFKEYASVDSSIRIDDVFHQIFAGQEKFNVKAPAVVSTWQSIHRLPSEWFRDFGMVIGDEAHLFKAKSLIHIMESCVNARYRIGTTGTLEDSEVSELTLRGLFGSQISTATTKELMDAGYLAKLKIEVLILSHPDVSESPSDYFDEIEYIVSSRKRLRYLLNLVRSLRGNTLVLFRYVGKHGKKLFELFNEELEDRRVYYIHGGTDSHDRGRIRAEIEKDDSSVTLASIGTTSTGIDVVNIHNVVLATPLKSRVNVLQSIGRGLRKTKDDRKTVVYDIIDVFKDRKEDNHLMRHGKERLQIYVTEKFDYKVHRVNL